MRACFLKLKKRKLKEGKFINEKIFFLKKKREKFSLMFLSDNGTDEKETLGNVVLKKKKNFKIPCFYFSEAEEGTS